MFLNELIDEINKLSEIRELEIIKNKIEKRMVFLLNKSETEDETFRIKVQHIDYKGSGKSWVCIIDENLKTLKFIKKHFLKKEKNRYFYYLDLPYKNVYLINQEGTKAKDERYYLYVDEYGDGHRISINDREEVKSLIRELIEY